VNHVIGIYTEKKLNKIGVRMGKGAIIHCSDSPHGRGTTAKDIDRWHREPPRGWSKIGYHFIILEDGTIEKGRELNEKGAHALGYNHFIGICLIGIDKFTMEQYESLTNLLVKLVNDKEIVVDNILGHCDVNDNKTCPNFDISLIAQVVDYRTSSH
jgi:N-acetylmuramoyl-L-alanine amidase